MDYRHQPRRRNPYFHPLYHQFEPFRPPQSQPRIFTGVHKRRHPHQRHPHQEYHTNYGQSHHNHRAACEPEMEALFNHSYNPQSQYSNQQWYLQIECPEWHPNHHPELTNQFHAPSDYNTKDPEVSWYTVQNTRRRRRSFHPQNQRIWTNNWRYTGTSNRFLLLDQEDDSSNLPLQPQSFNRENLYSQSFLKKETRRIPIGTKIQSGHWRRKGSHARPLIRKSIILDDRRNYLGSPASPLQPNLAYRHATHVVASGKKALNSQGAVGKDRAVLVVPESLGRTLGKRPSSIPNDGAVDQPEILTAKISSLAMQGPAIDKRADSLSGTEANMTGAVRRLTWAEIVRCETANFGDKASTSTESVGPSPQNKEKQIIIFKDTYIDAHNDRTVPLHATSDDSVDSEKFQFFGEEGFDSIKIESKIFRFAARNNEIEIFEMQKSSLRRINFRTDLALPIVRFIHQLTGTNIFKHKQSKTFGSITVAAEFNKSGPYLKIAKENGTSISVPMGPQKCNLKNFLTLFSNFAELPYLVREEIMDWEHDTLGDYEEITISKLIFNFEIQRAFGEKQQPLSFEKQPQIPLLQAYSDASDSFDYSDDSFYSDDFLGHATESDRRPPLSNPEEIKKSKFNRTICRKSKLVTSGNCLPTENLNTQLKIYRKSQKNKRRHSMTTRSQSRDFPWV
ncbi:unnamed protein product [Cuscuta epithymum]|uniref:Uncharacterized protein n=1 Tax=Cuscuta epithymum TaxID=186058 RepID=A0AAV0DR43_9ASTE|nr:unnamed protein product [Cuscuta epithymum]